MLELLAYCDLRIMEYLTTWMVRFYFWKYDIHNWQLKFFNATTMGGQVHYEKQDLNISRYFLRNCKILSIDNWILHFPILNLRNLILHEIAHILTQNEEQHHGPLWRTRFKNMGGDGETCIDFLLTRHDFPWIQCCTNQSCGEDDFFCFRRTRVHCHMCGSYLHSKPNHFHNINKTLTTSKAKY